MPDTDPRPTDATPTQSDETHKATWRARMPRIVWIVVSVAFLGYLALGSIEARIWTFGRLLFQDRKIVHVWSYFGDRLPDMPASPLFPVLYYLSIGVMVAGTVLGLWYFLVDSTDAESSDTAGAPVSVTNSPQTDNG